MKINNRSTRPKIKLIIFAFLIRLFFGGDYHLCKKHKRKEKSAAEGMFDWARYHSKGKERVLLREAETCPKCKKIYMSLYPLRMCGDHEGLEGV